jgi:hypothetical protein
MRLSCFFHTRPRWYLPSDSNRDCVRFERISSAFGIGKHGRNGEIRTLTDLLLRQVPLPLGYVPVVYVLRFELRTDRF